MRVFFLLSSDRSHARVIPRIWLPPMEFSKLVWFKVRSSSFYYGGCAHPTEKKIKEGKRGASSVAWTTEAARYWVQIENGQAQGALMSAIRVRQPRIAR